MVTRTSRMQYFGLPVYMILEYEVFQPSEKQKYKRDYNR